MLKAMRRCSQFLMLCALQLASLSAFADKERPTCPKQPIRIGLYEFGRFYHAGAGLDKDVAELLAARSGCPFVHQILGRNQIWQNLQTGELDMTLSAAVTRARSNFAWGVPYLQLKNKIILSKEVDKQIHSADDFINAAGLRLGVVRGHFAGQEYENLISQLRNIGRTEEVDDPDRLYAMFKAGRFQAIIASQLVYSHYLNLSAIRVEDWDSSNGISANLLISKRNFNQDEARRWSNIVREIVADGSLLRKLSQYTDPDSAVQMLPKQIP